MKKPLLFSLFFIVLVLSLFPSAHAQINVTSVTSYTWSHSGSYLLQNCFAQTFDYVTFAWTVGATVKIVVVNYNTETVYRFQEINLGTVDMIRFGGLAVFNFTQNVVLIALTYRYSYNVYACVIHYNAQTGGYTRYTLDSGFQPDAVNGTSQIIQANDSNFYFCHSGLRAGTQWFYVFRYTTASVLSTRNQTVVTYGGGYIHAVYDGSVDSDNIYFVCASTYFYVYKFNKSNNNIDFVVAGSSPTDTLYTPTHQVLAKLFYGGAVYMIFAHAFYIPAPTDAIEVHMNVFDLTNGTVSLFYVGGESYFGDAVAKATYGIGVLTATQCEFFAVNNDGDIFSFQYTLSGVPLAPTVTDSVFNQIAENVLTSTVKYAYKYRGNYKVEINTANQIWCATKNLYMGYVAQYSASLLYPNSTNLEIYQTYKIGIRFLGDGIPVQNQPVVIRTLYPDESEGIINMITDNDGVCDFYFAVYARGLYFMTLKLYVSGVNVYNYSVTWKGVGFGEEFTPPSDTGEQISHAVAFLVPLSLLFVPAVILAGMLGIVGLLAGFILGGLCLYIAGYLPIWAMFLLGLVIIFLIMNRKGGTSE